MKQPHFLTQCRALMVILLATLSLRSQAQSDEVLAAPTVSGLVVLGVQNDAKTLLMTGNKRATDKVEFVNAAPYKGDLIMLRNAGFSISYHTVNPLRYQVSAKRTGIASDGYQEAVQSLLTSVSSIITATSGGELSTGTALSWGALANPTAERLQNIWTLNFPQLAKFDDPAKSNNSKEDRGLRDTKLKTELLQVRLLAGAYGKDDKETAQTLVEDLTMKVMKAEQNVGFDYLKTAVPLIKRLFEVDFTNKHADDEIKDVYEQVVRLDTTNVRLGRALDSLAGWKAPNKGDKASLLANAETPADKKKIEGTKALDHLELAELLNQAFAGAESRLKALHSERVNVAKQVRDLANALYKEKGVVDYSDDHVHRILATTLPKDSIAKFTLTVKERWFEVNKAFNITQKDSLFFQRDIRLMKTHTFYPQIFPAVVFSELNVRTFSLNNDTLVEGAADEKPIKVAGMVNFNFKMGTRQEVPFLQLGTSFLKSRPIIYTGVGCRFTEWFGISFGAMFVWRPDLTDLKVGDMVKDQTTLDKDLTFQLMKPSYYLALQFRPTSLTTKK